MSDKFYFVWWHKELSLWRLSLATTPGLSREDLHSSGTVKEGKIFLSPATNLFILVLGPSLHVSHHLEVLRLDEDQRVLTVGKGVLAHNIRLGNLLEV